ncbi:unnamed protein product [Ambrosiozyma monospora]|uniref:Unnamed protein product n=1 Tax=Ambrosiozyma monospora TaxID=43982 RepID=A0ACB5TP06_AMBMO|nr:unnamed protein product [Ambrosiozyma monospora]
MDHLLIKKLAFPRMDNGAYCLILLALEHLEPCVHVARHITNPKKLYAVKTIKCDPANKYKVESSILIKLHHTNIIRVYEEKILEHEGDEYLRIFQDLAIGGDLFSYMCRDNASLFPLPESESLFITYQILKALSYLHSHGVVHRDLKLDNVLIMDVPIQYPFVVLADFGIAKEVDVQQQDLELIFSQYYSQSLSKSRRRCTDRGMPGLKGRASTVAGGLKQPIARMHTIVGTAEYAAPEINILEIGNKVSTEVGYDEKVDIPS